MITVTGKNTWRAWSTAVTILIILLASGLRFYKLDAQSFWNDEGNSARLSERTIPLIIEGTASDIHPPLYYLLLRGWRELLGEHEFGLRSFSAFAGVLTVAGTVAMGKLVSNYWSRGRPQGGFMPLLAGFLVAVNPALIYYSQETRMYALLALIGVLSTLFLLYWLRDGRWRWAGAYLLGVTAGMYSHYFFLAVLLVQNLLLLFWLIRHRGQRPLRPTILTWIGMLAAVFLFYLPWLPIFIGQVGGRPAVREPLLTYLWDSVRWLSFGETIAPETLFWPTIAVLALVLWALIVARGKALIGLVGTAVPVLLMVAAGSTQPTFFKFLVTAVPFFCLWLASSWSTKTGSRRTQWGFLLTLPFLLLMLWGTVQSLTNLYFNPDFARADYRGMVARIAAENHPNAGIILDAPNQWEVFTYYHRDGAPVYPLPKGQPDPTIVEPQLAQIAADHDRLYAIFWGEDQRDPQRIVERWLDAHAFKATDEWVGDVRFVTYAVPTEAATEPANSVDIPFGDQITLRGFSLPSEQLAPGDIVQVTLFWETAVALDMRYKVFLHLVNENGQLAAQRDSEPGGGLILTTTWQPGQVVADNHGLLLPADLPAGNYALLMGLYDVTDPSLRLPIRNQTQALDAWPLAQIEVR